MFCGGPADADFHCVGTSHHVCARTRIRRDCAHPHPVSLNSCNDVLVVGLRWLLQIVTSCLCGYMLHWFERHQRLRYKQQVPPAVAAMQSHMYGLPAGLVAAQVRSSDNVR